MQKTRFLTIVAAMLLMLALGAAVGAQDDVVAIVGNIGYSLSIGLCSFLQN